MEDIPIQEETHTKSLKKKAVTWRLVFALISSTMGFFSFGYNLAVLNNPETLIKTFLNSTFISRTNEEIPESTQTILWAFIVAIWPIGGMLGGFLTGWWADRLGRKRGMIFMSPIGIVGGVCAGLGKPIGSFEIIIVGRFLLGVYCGLQSGVNPLYSSEISPAAIRGAVGALNSITLFFGVLLSTVFGLEELLGSEDLWPVLLGLAAVPPTYTLLTMPFCPESPRYLFLEKDDEAGAKQGLQRFRGTTNVTEELDEMRMERQALKAEKKMSVLQLLRSSQLRRQLAICLMMQISQQLSGMNVVFYYSRGLFEGAGLSTKVAGYANISIGFITVIMSTVTVFLMDRAGRRTLHLIGLTGMMICNVVFTVTFSLTAHADWLRFISLASVLVYIAFVTVGPAIIPFLIVAELFSQGPRASAYSVSMLVNWACNFIIGQTTPSLQVALKNFIFVPFIILMLIFIVVLYKILPETKGKTYEQIASGFAKKDSPVEEGKLSEDHENMNNMAMT